MAYGGGRFVAVGGGGTVWWADADDLGQWHSAGPLAPFTLRAVAYGNGRFVAVGVDGHAFWSKDGSYGSWSGGQVGGGGFAF